MKKHFVLVTGNVVYQPLESQDAENNPMGILTLNAVVTSDNGNITVATIANAQKALQHNFYVKTEDNSLRIMDVIVTNMCKLGEMTEEEFHVTEPKE